MRISHQYKFVFLATPRTGSTTIRNVLDQYSDIISVRISQKSREFPFYDHISAPELKRVFDKNEWVWEDYSSFCVVRNPYDRVVSLYHHHLKMRDRRDNKFFLTNVKDALTPAPSFKKFVFAINPRKRLTTALEYFIGAQDGAKPLVNDVLQFERLEQDIPNYLGKLGLEISAEDIPHLNASESRNDYRKYYCEDTRKRVSELYRYEIERFGYSFSATEQTDN